MAAELESEGLMAEETPMVQAQVPDCFQDPDFNIFKQQQLLQNIHLVLFF